MYGTYCAGLVKLRYAMELFAVTHHSLDTPRQPISRPSIRFSFNEKVMSCTILGFAIFHQREGSGTDMIRVEPHIGLSHPPVW